MKQFEETKAYEVFKKAYLKVPVGEPSIHVSLKRKLQPYQKDIIKLIQKGKKPMIRLIPPASPKLKLYQKHLLESIESDKNQLQDEWYSEELNTHIMDKLSEQERGTVFTTGALRVECDFHKHRPTMIMIDDPYAPLDIEKKRQSFLQEYQCDFKPSYKIMHYDDVGVPIKQCIDLREFGIDRDKKSSKTYYVDCVVISIRNGTPRVSYYANMNDFASHPKFKDDNLVVCLHEQYRRSETK